MTVSALTQFDPSHFFQAPVSAPQGTQRLDTKGSANSVSSDLTGRLSVARVALPSTHDMARGMESLQGKGEVCDPQACSAASR